MKSLWYPGPKVVLCLMADFPTLLYTWNLGIQLFFMPEAWKVYPIRAEPPCIGHYREYSPTSEIFSAIRSKTFGTRCKPAMYITKKKTATTTATKQWGSSSVHVACSAGVFFERAICSRKRHVETSSEASSSLVFFQSSVKPFSFVGLIVYGHKSKNQKAGDNVYAKLFKYYVLRKRKNSNTHTL